MKNRYSKLPSKSTLAFICWALEAFPKVKRVKIPKIRGHIHRKEFTSTTKYAEARALYLKQMIDQLLTHFQLELSLDTYHELLNYLTTNTYEGVGFIKAMWHIFYYLRGQFPSVMLRTTFEKYLDQNGYTRHGRGTAQDAHKDIDEHFPASIDFRDALITRFWDFCTSHPNLLTDEQQILGEAILKSEGSPVGDPNAIIGGLIYLLNGSKTQWDIAIITGCADVTIRVWARKLRQHYLTLKINTPTDQTTRKEVL